MITFMIDNCVYDLGLIKEEVARIEDVSLLDRINRRIAFAEKIDAAIVAVKLLDGNK